MFKKNIKIGILGGTFDPPHIGHLHISKIGIRKIGLTKLIWIITKKNPLKRKPRLFPFFRRQRLDRFQVEVIVEMQIVEIFSMNQQI